MKHSLKQLKSEDDKSVHALTVTSGNAMCLSWSLRLPFQSCADYFFDQALQLRILPANWAKEVFKLSIDLTGLIVEIESEVFSFWIWGFLRLHCNGCMFSHFCSQGLALAPNQPNKPFLAQAFWNLGYDLSL